MVAKAPLDGSDACYSCLVHGLGVELHASAFCASFVRIEGTWGDIAEDLVVALYNANQFGLFWTNSTAADIQPAQCVTHTLPALLICPLLVGALSSLRSSACMYPLSNLTNVQLPLPSKSQRDFCGRLSRRVR